MVEDESVAISTSDWEQVRLLITALVQKGTDLNRMEQGWNAAIRAVLPLLPVSDARETIARALVDMTAAYHHERSHDGKWDRCQHPRCQNARLALDGRGPYTEGPHSLEARDLSGSYRGLDVPAYLAEIRGE